MLGAILQVVQSQKIAGCIRRPCWAKKLYFMGDDTWMQLFPESFTKSWPFPSLNVKDLHTVDNGVLEHLVPQIRSGDWDILIGHFLGVDHCGHRFGPYHPAIGEKLQQMDAMIRSVMAELSNDTVLLVFGDHGMTRSGDHGGDSADEVSSALFVYSPSPMSSGQRADYVPGLYKTVSQIDLVPSLSLLLGLPIPFNNLGQVIPDLFEQRAHSSMNEAHTREESDSSVDQRIIALLENARQVDEYLRTYSATSSDLPGVELQRLTEHFQAVRRKLLTLSKDKAGDQDTLVAELQSYMNSAQALCRQVWARFDIPFMLLGLVHLLVSACIAFLIPLRIQLGMFTSKTAVEWQFLRLIPLKRVSISFIITMGMVCLLWSSSGDLSLTSFVLAAVLALSVSFVVALANDMSLGRILQPGIQLCNATWVPDICAVTFTMVHAGGFMSNSFVVQEDNLMLSFSQLLLIISWCSGLPRLRKGDRPMVTKRFLSSLLVVMISCRIAVVFRGCREEQSWCQPSSFLLHYSTTFSHIGFSLAMLRLVLACLVVALAPLMVNLMCIRRLDSVDKRFLGLLVAASVCVCGHFCLQSLPLSILDRLYGWQHVALPRLAFLFVIAAFIYMWHGGHLTTGAKLSQGWYTLLSAVWILLTMVLGDGLVFASCAALLSVTVGCRLVSFQSSVSTWTKAALWAALSGHFFFSTGHQCDLPSIRFDAAFVGLHGDQQAFVAAGALVLLNMFASPVLFTLAIPLACRIRLKPDHSSADKEQTPMRSNSKSVAVVSSDAPAMLFYFVFYHHVMLIAAAVAATVLRRHLMVWKIFAPRLLYAAVSAELVCVLGAVVFALLPSYLPPPQSSSSDAQHERTSHSM
eukprot:scpid39012/ scgid10221/ GPI ethanolamine phosphate transferase 3; Phosphatidylinositol-glycan biosynthesis class O protein